MEERIKRLEELVNQYAAQQTVMYDLVMLMVRSHPDRLHLLQQLAAKRERFQAYALNSRLPSDAWLHALQDALDVLLEDGGGLGQSQKSG